MKNNKIVLAIDFDNTLSKNNVARDILRNHLDKGFQDILDTYLSGEISFREYQEKCFITSGLNIPEIINEAKKIGVIRDGFFSLLELINSFDGEVIVVSAGLEISAEISIPSCPEKNSSHLCI